MSVNPPTRILPPIWFFLALALILVLHRTLPLRRVVSAPWTYLGIGLIALAALVMVWAARLFGRHETSIRPFKESSALVRSGPYRFSRNPMYLCMVVVLLGTGVLLGTLTPLLVIPAFAAWIRYRFIRVEETMLAETFRAEYEAYRRSVRRWI